MLQIGRVTSQVDIATTVLLAMTLLVRGVRVQPVLNAQRMRMMVDRTTTMRRSDHSL
jgi:hypothetical protein